jgi:hypothetical protein
MMEGKTGGRKNILFFLYLNIVDPGQGRYIEISCQELFFSADLTVISLFQIKSHEIFPESGYPFRMPNKHDFPTLPPRDRDGVIHLWRSEMTVGQLLPCPGHPGGKRDQSPVGNPLHGRDGRGYRMRIDGFSPVSVMVMMVLSDAVLASMTEPVTLTR